MNDARGPDETPTTDAGGADAGGTSVRGTGRRKAKPVSRARQFDQFYTKDAVAQACMIRIQETIGVPEGTWIEPSAGAGAFLRLMPTPRIGIDVDPAPSTPGDVDVIVAQNFLKWGPPSDVVRPLTFVGNPPFGRNASLVFKFFDHLVAMTRAGDHVCFILPRTFEKVTTQRKVNEYFELVPFHDKGHMTLAANSFEHDGGDYDVPCTFQIWRRRDSRRRDADRRLMTHPDYKILASTDGAHFTFQRVGARAGTASVEGLEKSWRSHYYIQSLLLEPMDLMKRFNDIDWSDIKGRTAGNPSIGKTDLAEHYAAYLDEKGIEPMPAREDEDVKANYDFGF